MSRMVESAAAVSAAPSSHKQASKIRCYVFVLNNPTAPLTVPDSVGYLIYQEEKVSTRHYQGYVEFKKPTRVTAVKKLGEGWKEMHLEPRRGTQEEAIAYCRKLESRTDPHVAFEHGTPSSDGVSRTYAHMIDALKAGTFVVEEHLAQYLRHKRSVDEYLRESKRLKAVDMELPSIVLTEWQAKLLSILSEAPDDRKIYWYYDRVGGSGKSTFTKYLIKNCSAVCISTTAKERVIRAYQGEPVVVMDITRQEGTQATTNYSILETLKNGFGFNTMYEPGQKLWKVPHVIVFSNFMPDQSQLSADRWMVFDITPHSDDPVDMNVMFNP